MVIHKMFPILLFTNSYCKVWFSVALCLCIFLICLSNFISQASLSFLMAVVAFGLLNISVTIFDPVLISACCSATYVMSVPCSIHSFIQLMPFRSGGLVSFISSVCLVFIFVRLSLVNFALSASCLRFVPVYVFIV